MRISSVNNMNNIILPLGPFIWETNPHPEFLKLFKHARSLCQKINVSGKLGSHDRT